MCFKMDMCFGIITIPLDGYDFTIAKHMMKNVHTHLVWIIMMTSVNAGLIAWHNTF